MSIIETGNTKRKEVSADQVWEGNIRKIKNNFQTLNSCQALNLRGIHERKSLLHGMPRKTNPSLPEMQQSGIIMIKIHSMYFDKYEN